MKLTDNKTGLAFRILAVLAVVALLPSCEKNESYSELLRKEEKAVNYYLAGQRVELNLPKDNISFEMGPEAPFYKIDPDGYVYMQVISKGDMNDRVEEDDKVYFRFNAMDLMAYWEGGVENYFGNAESVGAGNYYFLYGNTTITASTQWGTAVQMPLRYFGYNCEVNLIIQSYYGFTSNMTTCIPYLMNLKYFRPEY